MVGRLAASLLPPLAAACWARVLPLQAHTASSKGCRRSAREAAGAGADKDEDEEEQTGSVFMARMSWLFLVL
jgi:hypothetical protein